MTLPVKRTWKFLFLFEPRKPEGCKFYDISVVLNGTKRGTILLSPEEWELLRSMLLHGADHYQDGEATLVIAKIKLNKGAIHAQKVSGGKFQHPGS